MQKNAGHSWCIHFLKLLPQIQGNLFVVKMSTNGSSPCNHLYLSYYLCLPCNFYGNVWLLCLKLFAYFFFYSESAALPMKQLFGIDLVSRFCPPLPCIICPIYVYVTFCSTIVVWCDRLFFTQTGRRGA